MRRATAALIAGAAVALLGGVQLAGAHTVRIERSTTVGFEDVPGASGDRVFGQLSIDPKSRARSPALASRCLAGQRVLIEHTLTEPGGGSEPVKVVGEATTDATGAWEFTSYEANGALQKKFDTFQIKVPKHSIGKKTHLHHHICKGASGFVTVASE